MARLGRLVPRIAFRCSSEAVQWYLVFGRTTPAIPRARRGWDRYSATPDGQTIARATALLDTLAVVI